MTDALEQSKAVVGQRQLADEQGDAALIHQAIPGLLGILGM